LEDADDLNVESANAFLKTLEEPPGAALILLLCSGWEQLLPTIRSRCQQIRLAPLNRTDIHAILTEHGITDPALQEEAWRWCRGSAARALALVEGGLPQLRQTLWEGLASGTIAVDRWTQQCIEYAEAAGKDSASQRERAELLLDLLVEALRQMLRQQVGASLAVADWSVSLTSVATLTPERLLDWLDRTLLAYTHLERRVPLPLLFEALFDYLARSLEQDTQPASAPT
ncbi:MAG: hypothetical protein NZ703_07115, partial [Gemmataceae bacterium]|nr:hypothetical protein [Gemmataceae bacterium]